MFLENIQPGFQAGAQARDFEKHHFENP